MSRNKDNPSALSGGVCRESADTVHCFIVIQNCKDYCRLATKTRVSEIQIYKLCAVVLDRDV